ncbi:MAG: cytochrome c biogenesis protein CcdA [Pseudomonadota bacterium]
MKRLVAICFFMSFFCHAAFGAEAFRVMPEVPGLGLIEGAPVHFNIIVQMPEGYYLYTDKLKLAMLSKGVIDISEIEYPVSRKMYDKHEKGEVEVCEGEVRISVKGKALEDVKEPSGELKFVLHLEGCSPKTCLLPEERTLVIPYDVMSLEMVTKAISDDSGINQKFLQLEGHSLFVILMVFFIGMLSSLTPCLWPVIPVLLLFIGVKPDGNRMHNLKLTSLFVLGLALTYSLLGLIVSAFGKNLGFLFQESWFLLLIVLFFIMMSLSLFGVFKIRMPSHLQEKLERVGGKGYKRSFLAGITTGLIASPCVTPVVAGVLGVVAIKAEYLWGLTLLLVYSLGMGIVFLILSLFLHEIKGRIKSGGWMNIVQKGLGVLMIVPAIYYGGILLQSQGLLGLSEKEVQKQFEVRDTVFEQAHLTHKPILLKFYASWCAPCRDMDRLLKKKEMSELLSRFVFLNVDMTHDSSYARMMQEEYKVIGVPTLIFLNSEGEVLTDLTINEPSLDLVKEKMEKALQRSRK